MTDRQWSVAGNLVDIPGRRILPSTILVESGRIKAIKPLSMSNGKAIGNVKGGNAKGGNGKEAEKDLVARTWLLPGLIDAHVHIESSMLVPTEFARVAVTYGTVATVSDPHEIGNVLGVDGVEYMLANAAQSPMKFCFGAPSCVPATALETAGATITVTQVETLLDNEQIGYLTEMKNFPGI